MPHVYEIIAKEKTVKNESDHLMIYDEIGFWGTEAKDVVEFLAGRQDNDLVVHINSPGGEVFDGISIFQALLAHKGNVTVKIEGLAASIASVIAMAGDEIQADKSSMLMIHNAWSFAAGDAEELRKHADLLEKVTGQLRDIYVDRTGMNENDVKALMDEETWMTAQEAKEKGFIDTIIDQEDGTLAKLSKGMAASVRRSTRLVAAASANKTQPKPKTNNTMDEKQINALIADAEKKLQAATDKEKSDLEGQIKAYKQMLADVKASAEADATELEKAHEELNALKKEQAETFAKSAIESGKFDEDSKDVLVNTYMNDKDAANKLVASVKAVAPAGGHVPVGKEQKNAVIADLKGAVEKFSKMKAGAERSEFYAKNIKGNNIQPLYNANTVSTAYPAMISEMILEHKSDIFPMLNAFTRDFSTEVEKKGKSVTTHVPVVPTAIDLSSGYTATDVELTDYTVTLDTFYGFVYGFTDSERSKAGFSLNDAFVGPAMEALQAKIFDDFWNLFVNANFSTSSVVTAANFDRDELVDQRVTLNATLKAPMFGRSVLCTSAYYANLVKTLNSSEVPGIDSNKAEAVMPRCSGFDIYEATRADANAENLGAVMMQKASIIMAARGVDDGGQAGRAAGVAVETITLPGLGLPIQSRVWYDANSGELKNSVGLLYGFKSAANYALRITSE